MEDTGLYEKALKKAFRLLAIRSRSTQELRAKLLERDFGKDVTQRVIKRLSEVGYLDDAAFARGWARYCAVNRLWGDRRIVLSLKEKGISGPLITEAIEHARGEITEVKAVEKVIEKKYGKKRVSELDSETLVFKEKRRIVQNLRGRGFPPQIIFDVLGKPKEECADEGQ